MTVDPSGRVLNSKMTSQCASGSGQFLENIARYLGVSLDEVGALSLSAGRGETVSSICAVLAETDVINMVSRGVPTPEILRGIHESMAGRLAKLLQALGASGVVFVTGGLAADDGLVGALGRALEPGAAPGTVPVPVRHPLSAFAGAIGAAIWGEYRYRHLGQEGYSWTSEATA
jgi:benzoyl-CoA reductase subunit D